MNATFNIEKIKVGQEESIRPILIAGPCSAETEEQTITTAYRLAAMGVKIFRAGIWKPRTRPGSFEGVGTKGLAWLKKVKVETGMSIGTEVATAVHVYEALKHGLDVLWIGARTTANPFAVQEIADSLRGVDIPILIKNPINPDVHLWIGAIERINQSGIKKVAAIHRGFSTYIKSKYRNEPQWQIPIELKRRIPEIQIISDPSHITGNRELIGEVAQQALDLNFDGLMIESHINPDDAWSDASQQLTPAGLQGIMNQLIIRTKESSKMNLDLEKLRGEIDELDLELLNTLEKRMMIAENIGRYKSENKITIFQPDRYNKIMEKRVLQANGKGLTPAFTERIFKSIHEESILHQKAIMNAVSEPPIKKLTT